MVGNKRLWSFRIAIGTHPHKEAAMAARLQAWGHETCRHEWYGTTTQSKRKVPWPKACYAWCLWFARVSLRATSLVVPSGSNLRIKHRLIWPGKGNQLAEPSGMRDFAPRQFVMEWFCMDWGHSWSDHTKSCASNIVRLPPFSYFNVEATHIAKDGRPKVVPASKGAPKGKAAWGPRRRTESRHMYA